MNTGHSLHVQMDMYFHFLQSTWTEQWKLGKEEKRFSMRIEKMQKYVGMGVRDRQINYVNQVLKRNKKRTKESCQGSRDSNWSIRLHSLEGWRGMISSRLSRKKPITDADHWFLHEGRSLSQNRHHVYEEREQHCTSLQMKISVFRYPDKKKHIDTEEWYLRLDRWSSRCPHERDRQDLRYCPR